MRGMDNAIKTVRILQIAMLASIVLYLFITWRFAPQTSASPNPVLLMAITFLAVLNVGVIFVMRRVTVLRAATLLSTNQNDVATLMRWRTGYIITYAIAEAIALFGLVLGFAGFPMARVLPFFVAGFVLILFFAPRRPSNAIG
jgi:hypothetical protein